MKDFPSDDMVLIFKLLTMATHFHFNICEVLSKPPKKAETDEFTCNAQARKKRLRGHVELIPMNLGQASFPPKGFLDSSRLN